MIALNDILILTTFIFCLGVLGIFLNANNLLKIFMCIELMLLAVSINFVAFSAIYKTLTGQVFALIILAVGAAEAAIGLAILILYYRNYRSISAQNAALMKG